MFFYRDSQRELPGANDTWEATSQPYPHQVRVAAEAWTSRAARVIRACV